MFHILSLSLLVIVHNGIQAHSEITRLDGATTISDITKDHVIVNGSIQAHNVTMSKLTIDPIGRINGSMCAIDDGISLGAVDNSINSISQSAIGTLTLHGDAVVEESTIGTLIVDAQKTTLKNCIITGDLVITYNPWLLSNKLIYGTGYSYSPEAELLGKSVDWNPDKTLPDVSLENVRVEGKVVWAGTTGRIHNIYNPKTVKIEGSIPNLQYRRDDLYFYSDRMKRILSGAERVWERSPVFIQFLTSYLVHLFI